MKLYREGISLSTSMKRATIMFVQPGLGRTVVQESQGSESAHLRKAIAKAYETFFEEYGKNKPAGEQAAGKCEGGTK